MPWDLLSPLLTVMVAVLVAVVTVRATRKKLLAEAANTDATAASSITDAALALVGPLGERIGNLEAEVKRLTEMIEEMSEREAALEEDVKEREIRLKAAYKRIAHLEDVCKRAGINGEEHG